MIDKDNKQENLNYLINKMENVNLVKIEKLIDNYLSGKSCIEDNIGWLISIDDKIVDEDTDFLETFITIISNYTKILLYTITIENYELSQKVKRVIDIEHSDLIESMNLNEDKFLHDFDEVKSYIKIVWDTNQEYVNEYTNLILSNR
jgi:hypothetical protein